MKLPILDDVPDDLPIVDKCLVMARNLGKEAGANFAHWVAQDTFGGRVTRNHKENARAVLESIESGDYQHMDIALPNLSGEYSEGMTPIELQNIIKRELDVPEGTAQDEEINDLLEDMCNEWEFGVGEGYEWQLAILAKSALE